MNKTAIRNFAVTARIKLKEAISQKAYELGITKTEIKQAEVYNDGFHINNKFFQIDKVKQRDKLIKKIHEQGYEHVIEEAAYTWFNRFAAIRFMEVNDFLPIGVRILSSLDPQKVEPDAVTEVLAIYDELDLDLDIVYRLQDENNTEELFTYILVKQCNKLGEIMPLMFERIEDFTELLLPDKLLSEGSVVRDLITMIDEEDWKNQVEIIGWLYQFYISEKKDQVFADLKKNKKITKENIPAATQLFTPKWIVQYMVENTLGRFWLDSHPNKELEKEWQYIMEETEQKQEVKEQLEKFNISPEEIKILDPCMGSGHILVYAFDVLYKIYQTAGYAEREIPQLILEKNIYGLDIDDRAAQLAYFALLMKARSYNRRVFRYLSKVNVFSICESNDIPKEALEFFAGDSIDLSELEAFIDVFKNAKNFGSILSLDPSLISKIESRWQDISMETVFIDIFQMEYRDILAEKIPQLINQARLLTMKYHVVVTNPPYMGLNGMNPTLSNYVKEHFSLSKADLSTVFMEVCLKFAEENGYISLINIPSWMFLGSFEKLRMKLIKDTTFINLLHLGRGIFGADFGTTSFVLKNKNINGYMGSYKRLFESQSAVDTLDKKKERFFHEKVYINDQNNYLLINGAPITYWAKEIDLKIFAENENVADFAHPKQGMATADNNRFLRFWHEVSLDKIGFGYANRTAAKESGRKWFPYNKGGAFRKWYGNNEYVINWENDGFELQNFKKSVIRSPQYYFRESITWSKVTIGGFSVRHIPSGFLFDVAGCSIFFDQDSEQEMLYFLGLLNSKVAKRILAFLSPTVNYEVGHIANIPVKKENNPELIEMIKSCLSIAKRNWNAFETSWDFKRHPLLMNAPSSLVGLAFSNWENSTKQQKNTLKETEEKINEIFISMYELQNELSAQIEEKEITIREADRERDIKSLISYAIGCLFGRYSLDQDGVVLAGGVFDAEKYITYKADKDNIIPITDDAYFEDDIVSRFIDFVRVTFGQENLEVNLEYIADTLTKKTNETARQRIRRYFLKEFYSDHLQNYQKRPIYWLFDSGKQDGFKVLIYLHRYNAETVARIRTDYLHPLQRKYEEEISRLDLIQSSDGSEQEKTKAKKAKEKIQRQILECQQYDQVLAHVANQKIEINLDDGVKVNYDKFQQIEVSQGEGKKPVKADLLAKI